jgi:hypothetical protein
MTSLGPVVADGARRRVVSVLITTPGDSRRHHVLAGAALHSGVPQVGLATTKRRKP